MLEEGNAPRAEKQASSPSGIGIWRRQYIGAPDQLILTASAKCVSRKANMRIAESRTDEDRKARKSLLQKGGKEAWAQGL